MIANITGGGGDEIVIATTGAGIAKTGMSAAAIATTAGITGIGTTGATGADLDVIVAARGSASSTGFSRDLPRGSRCLASYLRAVFLS